MTNKHVDKKTKIHELYTLNNCFHLCYCLNYPSLEQVVKIDWLSFKLILWSRYAWDCSHVGIECVKCLGMFGKLDRQEVVLWTLDFVYIAAALSKLLLAVLIFFFWDKDFTWINENMPWNGNGIDTFWKMSFKRWCYIIITNYIWVCHSSKAFHNLYRLRRVMCPLLLLV